MRLVSSVVDSHDVFVNRLELADGVTKYSRRLASRRNHLKANDRSDRSDPIRFDSIRFDSVRFDSIRFGSIPSIQRFDNSNGPDLNLDIDCCLFDSLPQRMQYLWSLCSSRNRDRDRGCGWGKRAGTAKAATASTPQPSAQMTRSNELQLFDDYTFVARALSQPVSLKRWLLHNAAASAAHLQSQAHSQSDNDTDTDRLMHRIMHSLYTQAADRLWQKNNQMLRSMQRPMPLSATVTANQSQSSTSNAMNDDYKQSNISQAHVDANRQRPLDFDAATNGSDDRSVAGSEFTDHSSFQSDSSAADQSMSTPLRSRSVASAASNATRPTVSACVVCFDDFDVDAETRLMSQIAASHDDQHIDRLLAAHSNSLDALTSGANTALYGKPARLLNCDCCDVCPSCMAQHIAASVGLPIDEQQSTERLDTAQCNVTDWPRCPSEHCDALLHADDILTYTGHMSAVSSADAHESIEQLHISTHAWLTWCLAWMQVRLKRCQQHRFVPCNQPANAAALHGGSPANSIHASMQSTSLRSPHLSATATSASDADSARCLGGFLLSINESTATHMSDHFSSSSTHSPSASISLACPICNVTQTVKPPLDESAKLFGDDSSGELDAGFRSMLASGFLRSCPGCSHVTLKEFGVCNVIECVNCCIVWNWQTRATGQSIRELKEAARMDGTLWGPGELHYQLRLQHYKPQEFKALLERNGIKYDPNYRRGT